MKPNKITDNKGLRALTTAKERAEIRVVISSTSLRKAPSVRFQGLKLQYIGKMAWGDEYGIDSRMWNVLAPKLEGYDYRSGGYPTFTIDGLKERKLI